MPTELLAQPGFLSWVGFFSQHLNFVLILSHNGLVQIFEFQDFCPS